MTCVSCGSTIDARKKYCDDCRDTSAPWRVNDQTLSDACAFLGITIPVVIRRSATRKLLGRYHGIKLRDNHPTTIDEIESLSDDDLNNFMYHYITVSARLTADQASRVLWHELTHAYQYESIPDYRDQYEREMAQAKVAAARSGVPISKVYKMISFEQQAIANETNHDSMFGLTLQNLRANMPDLKSPHHRIQRVVDGNIVFGPNAKLLDSKSKIAAANAAAMLR